jgi:PTS system mannose-specific IIC component
MTVLQAILIAILYYVANSPWPFGGLGNYATIYRPMVSGLVVGIILGDPVTGTIVGATINLMYIGFISAGGSMPADMSLAGILGTAIAITSGIDAEAAVAFAVPLGLLGALVWVGRLTLDSFFVRVADKYVEEGKPEKVWIANILLPQVLLFFMTFIPCFLAALYGTAYVKGFIDSLSGKFLGILSTIGGMLPAVGIGMMLLAIYKGRARIFFFLGFFADGRFNHLLNLFVKQNALVNIQYSAPFARNVIKYGKNFIELDLGCMTSIFPFLNKVVLVTRLEEFFVHNILFRPKNKSVAKCDTVRHALSPKNEHFFMVIVVSH